MNAELADAIRLFRQDQELALKYIHGDLRIPVPRTACEWTEIGHTHAVAAEAMTKRDGVTLYVHGYGIEVTHPEFQIDFDYGPDGQCDCFYHWRLSLHRHMQLSLPNPVDDPRPISEWLAEAVDAGDLIKVAESYTLHYDPRLRSEWTHSSHTADNNPMDRSGGSAAS